MITEIKEPIDMLASFVKGKLRPSAFYWQGKKHQIYKVLGAYHDTKGKFRRYFYAVQAGTDDIYEVCLDTENMQWQLIRIHYEG